MSRYYVFRILYYIKFFKNVIALLELHEYRGQIIAYFVNWNKKWSCQRWNFAYRHVAAYVCTYYYTLCEKFTYSDVNLKTLELVILTKCHKNWAKIVDFLLIAYFWAGGQFCCYILNFLEFLFYIIKSPYCTLYYCKILSESWKVNSIRGHS